ncbi:MAG: hypothetical protein ACKVT2_10360 [Saprospiraceae bacterium]
MLLLTIPKQSKPSLMLLAKPIPELRKDLHAMLVEDLPATLTAPKELLPESCDKHALVTALQAKPKFFSRSTKLTLPGGRVYELKRSGESPSKPELSF